MNHHDSPISYISLLKTHKIELTKEDSWLVASIMAMPVMSRQGGESIASSLLNIFSGHSFFKKIKRVSLVRRLGESNQLAVICSANIQGISNSMDPGYSCFTNSSGSLFSLKPNSVRFFSAAEEVVKEYEIAGHPPQRSIARVAKMSIGGGICAAMMSDDRRLGFLFLNGDISAEDLAFENVALLLSIVAETIQKYFMKSSLSAEYYKLSKDRIGDYAGKRVNNMTLTDAITHYSRVLTGADTEISVKAPQGKKSYLVSHGNVSQIIARVLAVLGHSAIADVDIVDAGKKLEFNVALSGGSRARLEGFQQHALDLIKCDSELLHMTLNCQNTSEFSLSVIADLASSDASVDYSVETV